jgi:hypothetical protein
MGGIRADVLVTVVEISDGEPRTSAELELLVSDDAIFYLYGDETLQVGSTTPPGVLQSLTQITPALAA